MKSRKQTRKLEIGKTCPSCTGMTYYGARYCPDCGARLKQGEKANKGR